MPQVVIVVLTAAGLIVAPVDGARELVVSGVSYPCGGYSNNMNDPAAPAMLDARAFISLRRCSGGFARIDRWEARTPATLVGRPGTAVVTFRNLSATRRARSGAARYLQAEIAVMIGGTIDDGIGSRVPLAEVLCTAGTCVGDTKARYRERIRYDAFPEQVPVRLWTSAGGGGSGSLDLHLTGEVRVRFAPAASA